MLIRCTSILVLLAATTGCGSRRVAGYLEELEGCSSSTHGPETTPGPGSSEDTTAASGDPGMTEDGSDTGAGMTEGETDTTAASSEGSTGEPTAQCGNGVLEAFGAVPEECDDGNRDPKDGCSDSCALDRRVFVSSELYRAGQLESLYLADALCANDADDQGWPDGLKYRAWLSDSKTDARDRFKRGRGRLVLANGLVLATSWPALLAGQLEYPIEVTEKSETYHGGVWTGTRPDGTAEPGSTHCDDWSSDSFLKFGNYGYSDRTTPEWTEATDADQPSPCNSSYAIYCFQSL